MEKVENSTIKPLQINAGNKKIELQRLAFSKITVQGGKKVNFKMTVYHFIFDILLYASYHD